MLIECVPNVSEGCRPDVVARLADEVRRVPGVRLLDYSSDSSHNRSVFTMVGDAASLELAVMALVEGAVANIDLRSHHGEHRAWVPLMSYRSCRSKARRWPSWGHDPRERNRGLENRLNT